MFLRNEDSSDVRMMNKKIKWHLKNDVNAFTGENAGRML
jgi:hypothetical protein